MVRRLFMLMIAIAFTGGVAYAAPADLPDTGQTTSYTTGDDGGLRKGVAWPGPRFTVSGDCVIDNLTGLMWGKSPATTPMTWGEAINYADESDLCGYTDWRLPNRKELRGLINYGEANSASWLNTQGFENVMTAFYWSSTTYASDTEFPIAWYVSMGDGSVGGVKVWDGRVSEERKYNYYLAWSVRSGQ